MDYRTIQNYFELLDDHLAERGFDSLDGLRRAVSRIESRRLIYFLVLATLGIAVAATMTAYGLPVLMMWMVLVLFGGAFSTLGSLRRRRQRERIAAALRAWESEHPLRPLAQDAYAEAPSADVPLHVRWLLKNCGDTVLDWMHNYASALAEVREAVEIHHESAELAG